MPAKAAAWEAVKKTLLTDAFSKWTKEAAFRKAQKLAEARRATQAHCQAIMDKRHKAPAESPPKLPEGDPRGPRAFVAHKLTPGDPRGPRGVKAALAPSPPPALQPSPPSSPEADAEADAETEAEAARATHTRFSGNQQWEKDYHNELLRLKRATQMEWSTQTGWATGASAMVQMYGPEYVNARAREREQWDVSRATFRANAKHMDRVRAAQYEQVRAAQVREFKDADDHFRTTMAMLKAERKEGAKRRAQMVTSISNYNHQTAAERHAHSVDVCAMLRRRPPGGDASAASSSMASASVHECVICFDAPCTHLATACGHVIGCRACCALQTECPICRVPTAFVGMRFPH